ncbi:MAG: hypothetical protein HY835_13055, partial [Anaerolineae bacterium]|nr:hypothetical protein [Anaerolineae bacterium]
PSITPSPSPTITPTPLPPAACLRVNAAREEAEVVAVLSANTIEVKTTESRYFVRYLGVDLVGDGLAGLALNRTLVEGKIVTLIGDATDGGDPEYRLRYVMSGDIFVNYALVRQGTAMTALFPSIPECMDVFLAGEALAKSELAGFWGQQGATSLPPGVGTLAPACDCKVRYACTDFASQSDAQACYNACGDYRNSSLDPDHNGLACDE